jgi:hypothetical protein
MAPSAVVAETEPEPEPALAAGQKMVRNDDTVAVADKDKTPLEAISHGDVMPGM